MLRISQENNYDCLFCNVNGARHLSAAVGGGDGRGGAASQAGAIPIFYLDALNPSYCAPFLVCISSSSPPPPPFSLLTHRLLVLLIRFPAASFSSPSPPPYLYAQEIPGL